MAAEPTDYVLTCNPADLVWPTRTRSDMDDGSGYPGLAGPIPAPESTIEDETGPAFSQLLSPGPVESVPLVPSDPLSLLFVHDPDFPYLGFSPGLAGLAAFGTDLGLPDPDVSLFLTPSSVNNLSLNDPARHTWMPLAGEACGCAGLAVPPDMRQPADSLETGETQTGSGSLHSPGSDFGNFLATSFEYTSELSPTSVTTDEISSPSSFGASPQITELPFSDAIPASLYDVYLSPSPSSPALSVVFGSSLEDHQGATRKNKHPKRSGLTDIVCRRPPIKRPGHKDVLRCQFEGTGCDRRRFHQKSKQTKHHKLHERPIKCEAKSCVVSHAHRRDMDRHMWNSHPQLASALGLPPCEERCEDCGRMFNRKDAVKKHRKNGACKGGAAKSPSWRI